MSIHIDLLPAYVGMRRWFKRLLVAALLFVAAEGAVLYYMYFRKQQLISTLETDLENFTRVAQQTKQAQDAKAAAEAASAPVKTVVDFLADAGKTGAERAALVDNLRRYIYAGSVITTLDLSDNQTLKVNATVGTPDEYARFLLNMRRGQGKVFADLATANGVPSYPNSPTPTLQVSGTDENAPLLMVLPLTVNAQAKLQYPITIPAEPAGSGGAPAAAGAPGMPGMPPGAPGMPPGGAPGAPPGGAPPGAPPPPGGAPK